MNEFMTIRGRIEVPYGAKVGETILTELRNKEYIVEEKNITILDVEGVPHTDTSVILNYQNLKAGISDITEATILVGYEAIVKYQSTDQSDLDNIELFIAEGSTEDSESGNLYTQITDLLVENQEFLRLLSLKFFGPSGGPGKFELNIAEDNKETYIIPFGGLVYADATNINAKKVTIIEGWCEWKAVVKQPKGAINND